MRAQAECVSEVESVLADERYFPGRPFGMGLPCSDLLKKINIINKATKTYPLTDKRFSCRESLTCKASPA